MGMLHGNSNMQLNIIVSKCSLDLLFILMFFFFFQKMVGQLSIRLNVLQNKKCMQLPVHHSRETSLIVYQNIVSATVSACA